jgi:uncharacterized protein with GYD domain
MKTFVLMTKMAHQDADIIEIATKLKGRARRESEWLKLVKKRCPKVKWLSHYALLGHWDFMDIYEAPDEDTAAIVSLLSRAHGAYIVESWTAIPNSRLIEIAEALQAAAEHGMD